MANAQHNAQHPIRVGVILFILSALLLACGANDRLNSAPATEPSVQTSPTESKTPTRTRTTTHTATISLTPSRTPRPTRTATIAPSPTNSPTSAFSPTPTPLQSRSGEFDLKYSLDEFPIGLLDRLFVLDESNILLSGSFGMARLDLQTNESSISRFRAPVIGADRAGRMWFYSDKGISITAWDGIEFRTFSRDQGWILQARSVDPAGLIVSQPLVSTGKETWLATARDVRRFDGARWRVFTASEIGIPIPYKASVQNVFALAVSQHTDEVWLGGCHWQNRQPQAGSGIWRFHDNQWEMSDFPIAGACITRVRIDSQNRVWASTPTSLWNLRDGQWIETIPSVSISAGMGEYRIENFWLNPANQALILVTFYNINGAPLEKHIQFFRDDQLIKIKSFPSLEDPYLFFSPDGHTILFSNQTTYQYQDDSNWAIISELPYQAIAQDFDKNIWLLSSAGGKSSLWRLRE